MKFRPVIHLIGWTLVVLGCAMTACMAVAWSVEDGPAAVRALAFGCASAFIPGVLMMACTRGHEEIGRREGFAVVVLSWLGAAIVGAVPFKAAGVISTWPAAVFETMSGFTTTGASVLADPSVLPKSLLLWRATTQFLGGMGVLVLVVAILPLVGTGGMQLFRAEMPGPTKDRLTPRIAGTAKRLWGVYVGFAFAETVLLRWAGMSWFEAICHTFTTVSTGGFSTRAGSIGEFQSPLIEWIVIAFMFLGGANFALHYRALARRELAYHRDSEFKLYSLIVIVAILLVSEVIGFTSGVLAPLDTLRKAAFAVVSVLTTTGFATEDFDRWPALARIVLFGLMFLGGCAGSTAGSIKIVRVLIVLRMLGREIYRWLQPDAVVSIKVDKEAVEAPVLLNVALFVVLYLLVFAVGTAVMAVHFGDDWVSPMSAVAACLGNIGPGLGAVGPVQTYAPIPGWAQLWLALLMLLGRLELFTVLVLWLPSCWRR